MFGITSLSRSGRNEVSTAGSLPSLFFLGWGEHGDAGRERERDGERGREWDGEKEREWDGER